MAKLRVSGVDTTIQSLDRESKSLVHEIANELEKRIKERTPVDTGRLKSNWERRKRGSDSIIIRNRTPYAYVVEYGLYRGVGPKTVQTSEGIFSKQAPRGMVRISAIEISQKYQLDYREKRI